MKLANQKDLEQLALKQQEEQDDLTQEELEYLYERALEEIEYLNKSTELYKNIIRQSFIGEQVLEEPMFNGFFEAMDEFFNNLLPATLRGDYDTLKEDYSEDKIEQFDEHRPKFYEILKRIYFKEE